MLPADRFLAIRRDPHSDEVLARGGDSEAHGILQRAGFVPVVRLCETYHRAPTDLTVDEETRLATEAVARLRAVGYHVDCDEGFNTEWRPPRYLPLGAQVAQLAERIREATTTDEVAEVLTELTASHDGILAAVDEILQATADFHDGMDDTADLHVARRLRYLADRHALHPGRSTCAEEVPATERERTAVYACPPLPRAVPASPPPIAAGPRR
ncbi:hypothetical protein ACFYM5_10425 [Streptomyces sp. NPDC006706]|uniref:hypothetical protein n=1 Tax=Streptomyces sp. NPDC006706 TaxID=3364761 RepID=UPI0036D1625E